MERNPPLSATYKALFAKQNRQIARASTSAAECDLPIIDLRNLTSNNSDTISKCKQDIILAASEWGFFQAVNHGISHDLLLHLRKFQENLFHEPFEKKKKERLRELAPENYCWGTPSATKVEQLSWSEAYHIPLSSISNSKSVLGDVCKAMSRVAHKMASILGAELGDANGSYIRKSCTGKTCYLRLNHYPPCREVSGAFGLAAHTDSDFLTVLYQDDEVAGLQLMKDKDCSSGWVNVRPIPGALIINVGDLFQAWSNNLYRSVRHRVVANSTFDRFSVAYFLCPSYDTTIEGYSHPTIYKTFSFGQYKQQIKEDVQLTGHKIGLARFLHRM